MLHPPRHLSRRQLLSSFPAGLFCCAATDRKLFGQDSRTGWSTSSNGYTFTWNIANDHATVHAPGVQLPIWSGGILPSFLIGSPGAAPVYVKATADLRNSTVSNSGGRIVLTIGALATGELHFEAKEYGVDCSELSIEWMGEPHPIVSLFFGTAPLNAEQQSAAPAIEETFWPDWDAACFCVPGAKGAPLQSVFRRWDLGDANLPLGSFGPSLGTPYAAAYPRPLYAAAMGNQEGWVCLGAGVGPDGALSLRVASSSACLHLLYREDLWGALKPKRRTWSSPLRIAWAPDPWRAYERMYSSFDSERIARSAPLQPQWNSWGDFKKDIYDLRGFARWTADVGAGIVGLDDRWESFVGSGEPDRKRFPAFDEDIRYIKSLGLNLGFWQPIGWIDEPERAGLSESDLLVGKDGRPRRTAWDTNPRSRSHYCLDPSSSGAVQFLRRRTIRLMQMYRPVLLKLDFGYGLPSPNAGVPRDAALRGERYSLRLLEIIAEAARSVDRDVAIEYYSLHPLFRAWADVIALDDLGDAGREEASGHRQWSIWSALGGKRSNIMASSGYDWNADAEVILDSAVIGVPGAVLSRTMDDGSPVPPVFVNRRRALNRWHRRSTDWSPLWLNSSPGAYLQDPVMRCFGRLENIRGENRLTAIALREKDKHLLAADVLQGVNWKGDWALIAQDDEDIFRSRHLACLPVGATLLELPLRYRPARVAAIRHSERSDWPNWAWESGIFRLSVPQIQDQLLGVLLMR